MAIKIIKNQGLSFVFAQKNAAHCISGQNKWLEAERLQRSLVDARKRAIRLKEGRLQRSLEDAPKALQFRV